MNSDILACNALDDPAAAASLISVLNYDSDYFWWYYDKYGQPPANLPACPGNIDRFRHHPYLQPQRRTMSQQQPLVGRQAFDGRQPLAIQQCLPGHQIIAGQQHRNNSVDVNASHLQVQQGQPIISTSPQTRALMWQHANPANANNPSTNPATIHRLPNLQNQANAAPPRAPTTGSAGIRLKNSSNVPPAQNIPYHHDDGYEQIRRVNFYFKLRVLESQQLLEQYNLTQSNNRPKLVSASSQTNPPLASQIPSHANVPHTLSQQNSYATVIPASGSAATPSQQQPQTPNSNVNTVRQSMKNLSISESADVKAE